MLIKQSYTQRDEQSRNLEIVVLGQSWILSILIHHRTFWACRNYAKQCDKIAKTSQSGPRFSFSLLKSTPALKKYTTAGCDGCGKYQLRQGHVDRTATELPNIEIVLKNGFILPRGQWYAPSAVINEAWYCMVIP